MKNIKNLFVGAVAVSLVACSSAPEETVETTDAKEVKTEVTNKTLELAANDAEITWVGFKTFADGRHEGTLDVTAGKVFVEGDKVVGGKFEMDMNTIKNTDLPEEGDYNQAKLVGHLASPDFFDVANHPMAMFEITDIAWEENAEKGTNSVVSGNLTMRGETKNITFPATVSVEGDMASIMAPEFSIDRKQWGVMYGSTGIEGLAKDNLIDDNILLTLNVKAGM
jgi:polyisoprenoid-binding protein YceI